MFSANSRYANASTYTVSTAGTRAKTAVRLPIRPDPPVRGFHRRTGGQRLDYLAGRYLGDATGFWRLCDANGAFVPDALGARQLVAIPDKA
jgi:hypothetical protein